MDGQIISSLILYPFEQYFSLMRTMGGWFSKKAFSNEVLLILVSARL